MTDLNSESNKPMDEKQKKSRKTAYIVILSMILGAVLTEFVDEGAKRLFSSLFGPEDTGVLELALVVQGSVDQQGKLIGSIRNLVEQLNKNTALGASASLGVTSLSKLATELAEQNITTTTKVKELSALAIDARNAQERLIKETNINTAPGQLLELNQAASLVDSDNVFAVNTEYSDGEVLTTLNSQTQRWRPGNREMFNSSKGRCFVSYMGKRGALFGITVSCELSESKRP